jgi:hypothetical protein
VRRAWAQLYFELFPYRRPHATIPIRPSQQPSRMTIPIQPSHTTFSKDDSHTTISIRLCSHTTLSTTIPARVSSYDHARTMPFMFPSQASIQTTIPIRRPFPYNDYPHTTMPMRSTPYDRFHTTIHTRPSTHDHPHTTIHTRPFTNDHSHTTIHKRPPSYNRVSIKLKSLSRGVSDVPCLSTTSLTHPPPSPDSLSYRQTLERRWINRKAEARAEQNGEC